MKTLPEKITFGTDSHLQIPSVHFFEKRQWLEARTMGLGGTDASVIVGANPYKQRLGLWYEKINPGAVVEVNNDGTFWGTRLEGVVREVYAEKAERVVVPYSNCLLRHPTLDYVLASIDGLILTDGLPEVYEGKTAMHETGWGPSESSEFPEQYFWQCQHYLAVTGLEKARLAVLISGRDFRTYTITKDPQLEAFLLAALASFWNCVQTKVAPDLEYDSPDALKLIREKYGSHNTTITLPSNAGDWVRDYQVLGSEIKQLETRQRAIRAKIEDMMQGNRTAYVEGLNGIRISNAPQSRTYYNVPDELKQQYAETRQTEPVFRITERKGK